MNNTTEAIAWDMRPFHGLTLDALHDLLRLRMEVFVLEQECVYPEIDGQDPVALHVTGHLPDGSLGAYARILPPDTDGLPHVGRVVVRRDLRRTGLGTRLMQEVLQRMHDRYGHERSALAAQAHLVDLYGRLGYTVTREPYMWDGILHVDMRRDPAVSGPA